MIRTISAAAALTLALTLTVSALPAYAAADSTVTAAAPAVAVPAKISQSLSRPAALPALYVSYAALQAFDVYSTRQGLARGAREANPLMQGVSGNTGAFVAMKVSVGVATIMAAERLWKTNKAAAIAVMLASNGVTAIVAARNARTLQQLR